MTVELEHKTASPPALTKAPTGIAGLDEITDGGLPRARTTLVCGGSGCGKTLMAMQFLVRGAVDHAEPGVFITFEESATELAQNAASLGWDLTDLQNRRLLAIDHIRLGDSSIVETGTWDLDGLLIRLASAVDAVGAKRIVLDTVEALFGLLSDSSILRSELRRLFRWLNDHELTAIVTGERGQGTMTRHGLEEYVSDCVILLDHRVHDQVSTRRLRVVKYRGSDHRADEYPFLIDRSGLSVLPISAIALDHAASTERVPTGVAELDEMLAGGGYFRGSTVLVSGTAGSGKSTLAAQFLQSACERGERGLMFAFEESPAQITRNLRSVSIDLQPNVDSGLLRIESSRPSAYGLEAHLMRIYQAVADFRPVNVAIDPLSGLEGQAYEVASMLARLIDRFKRLGITAIVTSLVPEHSTEPTALGISSLIDTWVDVRNIELDGERNRGISILKSRGMAHSTQVREFQLTRDGIHIRDAFAGEHGVLMGSARRAQEARDAAATKAQDLDLDAQRRRLQYRRSALEAQIAALRAQLQAETLELPRAIEADATAEETNDG